jgi:hypothetical protein
VGYKAQSQNTSRERDAHLSPSNFNPRIQQFYIQQKGQKQVPAHSPWSCPFLVICVFPFLIVYDWFQEQGVLVWFLKELNTKPLQYLSSFLMGAEPPKLLSILGS